MKYYVIAYEPDLNERKQLTQVFSIKQFIVKFISNIEDMYDEMNSRTPHFILMSLDDKALNSFKKIKSRLPKETIVISTTLPRKKIAPDKIAKMGIRSNWEKPFTGLKMKKDISEFVGEVKPMRFEFSLPVSVGCSVNGTIEAMGEADLMLKVPLRAKHGTKVDLVSLYLNSILKEKKNYVVTESRKKSNSIFEKYLALAMVGLTNQELKAVRSAILHWDKL